MLRRRVAPTERSTTGCAGAVSASGGPGGSGSGGAGRVVSSISSPYIAPNGAPATAGSTGPPVAIGPAAVRRELREMHVTLHAGEDRRGDAEQRDHQERDVARGAAERHAHVGARRDDHHLVRGDAVRTVGARHLASSGSSSPSRARARPPGRRRTTATARRSARSTRSTGSSATGSIGCTGFTTDTSPPRVSALSTSACLGSSTVPGGRLGSGTSWLMVDGDVDVLPVVRPVVGGDRRPLVLVLEPRRAELEVALTLVAPTVVHHHRLHARAAPRCRSRRRSRCSTGRSRR